LGFGVFVPLVEVFVEVSLVPMALLDPLGLVALPWPLPGDTAFVLVLLLAPRSVLY
jgi:hypothetical protein